MDNQDKKWLDETARREGKPMTGVIREAIREYRIRHQTESPTVAELLDRTKGTWKKDDGLKYQKKLRSEWD
jgi:hypothetical protein